MILNIKYFGELAELTNCDNESVSFTEGTVSEMIEQICARYPELKSKEFQVAENKVLVTKETIITNPEIALLPPFSGG